MSSSGSTRMSRTRSLMTTMQTTWAVSVVLAVMPVAPVALETLTSPSLVVLTPPHSVQWVVKVVSVLRMRVKMKAKMYVHPFPKWFSLSPSARS